jgi:CDGSH-type Zn-finger protein
MPDDKPVTILVRNNGPYRVYGPARLVDHDGNEIEVPPGEWFVLCRCGHSKTKPFCDSTHKTIPWNVPGDWDTEFGEQDT